MASGVQRGAITFTGHRLGLGAILLRGYLLMVPTIGLYRFWLTTWKRRYYWFNTTLDGDALEYSGEARQLLLGFLMALAVFLPLYAVFFVLSTQSRETVIIGYGAVALLIWFLYGYAAYRARDFRLSRTLWRGIRFDQTGNAWGYALRRFLWSALNLATLGLAYPFMAGNLWAYRYRHSWYGDRPFAFAGSWKNLAVPYYLCWLVGAGLIVTLLVVAGQSGLYQSIEAVGAAGWTKMILLAGGIGVLVTFYRSIEMTRMFSAIRLGAAALVVHVRFPALLGIYVFFGAALLAAYILLAVGGLVVLGAVAGGAVEGHNINIAALLVVMQSSTLALLAIISGYLLLFGAFAFVSELFLGYGYWRMLAKSARITGLEALGDIRSRPEDKALAGEGLADALNVGGY